MSERMNPEIKAEWLKRLRSGEIAQTTGVLHRLADVTSPERMCCLGVLSAYAAECGVVSAAVVDCDALVTYDENSSNLPYAVTVWAGSPEDGLSTEIPYKVAARLVSGFTDDIDEGLQRTTSLAELNDSGASFADIANIIEEYL